MCENVILEKNVEYWFNILADSINCWFNILYHANSKIRWKYVRLDYIRHMRCWVVLHTLSLKWVGNLTYFTIQFKRISTVTSFHERLVAASCFKHPLPSTKLSSKHPWTCLLSWTTVLNGFLKMLSSVESIPFGRSKMHLSLNFPDSTCGPNPPLPQNARIRLHRGNILFIGCKENYATLQSGWLRCNSARRVWTTIRHAKCLGMCSHSWKISD